MVKPITQFITENYKIISNVENIEDADIICLSEEHHSQSDRINNAKVIDSLYNDSMTVLVEERDNITTQEYQGQPLGLQQTRFVTKPIAIKGWDLIFNRHFSVEVRPFKTLLSKVIALSSVAVSLGLRNPLPLLAIGGLLVHTGLSAAGNIVGQMRATIPARNRNMCRVVEETLSKTVDSQSMKRRIIILGGVAHFVKLKGIFRLLDLLQERPIVNAYNQSIQETTDYLKTKKFAILVAARHRF